MFGDLVSDGLRTFSVIGPQVHVYESPVVLVGNLRAEAIHLVIAAGNSHQLCTENLGDDDFCLLEIRGNKDPAFESVARGLSGRGVCKIPGGGTRNRVESKAASVGKRNRDYAVFEAQRGQANRVVFNVEILGSDVAS